MSSEKIPNKDLELKEKQRSELKKTLGEVVEGALPKRYKEKRPIVAVGDHVTHTLLEQDIVPDIGIVDNKTQRGPYRKRDWRGEEFDRKEKIVNPPERITVEAWRKIENAIKEDKTILIMVEGEEDLLSLPAITLCPLDGLVIYGIPEKGMVINQVSKELRKKAWEVINNMIEVNEGR